MTHSTRPNRNVRLILISDVIVSAVIAPAASVASGCEPNVEVASAWWPEMENTWVPIGWKDHPLRLVPRGRAM